MIGINVVKIELLPVDLKTADVVVTEPVFVFVGAEAIEKLLRYLHIDILSWTLLLGLRLLELFIICF
jgi:hypothetical protein